MEIRRLRYFIRIAEDGSLSKAAGVLRVAQPALSRQIHLLEEELGVPLFKRSPRGMQLTEQGEFLRDSVLGPLRSLEVAIKGVRSQPTRIEGDFAIGMPSSIGTFVAADLVRKMKLEYPHIRLRIMEGITGSLIDWLHRGLLDFALLEEESRDDRLIDARLLQEPLMLVGGLQSDIETGRPLSFERVLKLPLMLPTHHLGIRGVFNDVLQKNGRTANLQFESDSCSLLKELAAEGMGYTLLPLAYFKAERRSKTLKYAPVAKPSLMLPIYLCHRADHGAKSNRAHGITLDTIAQTVKASAADNTTNRHR